MDGSGEKPIKTPFGSYFHKEIMKKHQTGKFNYFRFPKMVFYKNIGYFHPEMINTNVFYLYITNKTIILSFTVKILPYLKIMISWFNTNNDLQSIVKPNNVKSVNNKTEKFQIESSLSWLFHSTSRIIPLFRTKENSHSEVKLKNVQNVSSETNILQTTLKFPWLYQFTSTLHPTFNTRSYLQSIVKLNNFRNIRSEKNVLQTAMRIPWLYQFTSRFFPTLYTKNNKHFETILENTRNVNDKTDIFLTASEIPCIHNFTSGLGLTNFFCANINSTIPFLKSLFFKSEDITNESKRLLNSLFLNTKTAYYQQVNQVLSGTSLSNLQILRHGNYMRIINPQALRTKTKPESDDTAVYSIDNEKKLISKHQLLFEHKSHSILSQNNLLINHAMSRVNRLFFEFPKLAAVNKPLVQTNYYSFVRNESNFLPKSFVYNTDAGSLHFRDTKYIEQEIENIKKVAIETKKSVLDKSKSSLEEADLKRYIDINRISDQVYQNIERTIKMERDRRGM